MLAQNQGSATRQNPYDFEYPVTDPTKFAGRFGEITNINYLLERPMYTEPHYDNIAIFGQRGIGKTSFLHKIESMAQDKGFLTVRLPLTEQLVTSEMEFFRQLYDAIMDAAHEKGMFDGAGASIYRAYMRATSLLDINTEAMHLPTVPFYFVESYIGWRLSNQARSTISIAHLRHDFALIREEARKHGIPAIMLLFDECQVLKENRALIQLLVTMIGEPSFRGWMVVFAGTNEMLTWLSTTYSPVWRRFVKFFLTGFKDRRETENCILLPLSEADKAFLDHTAIDEIHRLTGGNPYEVQLTCFYMYEHFARNRLPRITLDHQVIDSVLGQLEEDKAVVDSHIPMIKGLADRQLRELQLVLPYEGWTVEQIARFNLISHGFSTKLTRRSDLELQESRTRIARIIGVYETKGLVNLKDGRIFFSGDRFERLYLKFFAEASGIAWNAVVGPYHAVVLQALRETLRDAKVEHGWTRRLTTSEKRLSTKDYVTEWKRSLEAGTLDTDEEATEVFVIEDKDFVRSFVYNLRKPQFLAELTREDEKKKTVAVRYRFDEVGDGSIYVSLFIIGPRYTLERAKNKVEKALTRVESYFPALGITVDEVLALDLKFIHLDDIARNAIAEENYALIREIQLAYLTEGREIFAKDDLTRSLALFKTVVDLPAQQQDPLYLAIAHNNLGFVLGALGRYGEAIHEWNAALELYPLQSGQMAMTYQDLSYVYFKLGKLEDALEAAEKAITVDHNMNAKVRWLFVKFCTTSFNHPTSWKWELIVQPRVATAAYCNMVAILAERNDLERATYYAKKAAEGSKDQPVVFRTQGWLALRMGQWTDAVDCFLKAQEMDPENPIIEEELRIVAAIAHEKAV